jgi:hypothetical protein
VGNGTVRKDPSGVSLSRELGDCALGVGLDGQYVYESLSLVSVEGGLRACEEARGLRVIKRKRLKGKGEGLYIVISEVK